MELTSISLKYNGKELKILDQRKLPHKEEWRVVRNPDDMCDIIETLTVRGAPLIGVSAALSLAQFAHQGASADELKQAAEKLKQSRPTAVNLMYCVDKVMVADDLIRCAEELFLEDQKLCDDMAKAGSPLIDPGDQIMTCCNTGGLATVGIGTAFGVIYQAHRERKNIHVYPVETRPLLQGGRLTTWELEQRQIPYTLICDNMAAHVMAHKNISKIFVGSDRIAKNGDVANKIGTYSLAVLAHHHQIPFYVVAPYTTLDLNTPSGEEIVIEQRDPEEVKGAKGSFGSVQWSPDSACAYNPAFDVTPRELITGYVLDRGFFPRKQFEQATPEK